MKPVCSICGRRTRPFAYLGDEPIGPNCARKLGLTKTAVKAAKSGRLRIAATVRSQAREAGPQTLELFPETL
jgi:hypothetical protein